MTLHALNRLGDFFRCALPRTAVLALVCAGMPAPAAQAAEACEHASSTIAVAPLLAPGIGGTGQVAARPGVGGTGIDPGMGGTGIVGIITGFASVCVNGVEVQFDASTPVTEDGETVSLASLAVGKLVAIEATGHGEEYAARRIGVLHLVVGPAEQVDPRTGTLKVLGQTVLAPAGVALNRLKADQWVQVSGDRLPDGSISASYLGTISPQKQAMLTGVLERRTGDAAVVSGTAVHWRNSAPPGDATIGAELRIRGEWDGHTLQAQSTVNEPTRSALGQVRQVIMEGLVASVDGQTISLGNYRWNLDKAIQVGSGRLQDIQPKQRVRISGEWMPGHALKATRIDWPDRHSQQSKNSDNRTAGTDSSKQQEEREDRSGERSSNSDDAGKTADTSGKSGSNSGSSSGSSGGSGSRSSGGSSSSGGSGGSGRSGGSGKGSGK